MVEPDFRLLGERIERIQAELRELRGVRADVAHLRAEVSQLRSDLIQMRSEMSQVQAEGGDRHESLSARVDNLERTMNIHFTQTHERIDNLERAMDARFTQVQETMATNLAIVLDAIKTR